MIIKNKKRILGNALVICILVFGLIGNVFAYSSSNYQAFNTPSSSYLGRQGIDLYGKPFDGDFCQQGSDFVLQINPMGCSPAVVRSDLLEEQNIPVFCPVMATKINPLIEVEAIDYMSFNQEGLSENVVGVGFHPARAAIKSSFSRGDLINDPVLDNIGYVVIVLKQHATEDDMPDFVQGNLTAHLRYDVENAFGLGESYFYLPELDEDDWENRYKEFSFWNGKAFVRAESVGENSARIVLYRDVNTEVASFNLDVNEESGSIAIPGFPYCMGRLKVKLIDLTVPPLTAKIRVGSQVYEVGEGEKFYDNACRVTDIDYTKEGFRKASIDCNVVEGDSRFDLIKSSFVKLSIDGADGEYKVGSVLEGFEKEVTLDKIEGLGKDRFKIIFVDSEGKIEGIEFGHEENEKGELIFRPGEKEIFGKLVKVNGFVVEDKDISTSSQLDLNYQNAMEKYLEVYENFKKEKIQPTAEGFNDTYGQVALKEAIELAHLTGQKVNMNSLCVDFQNDFPEDYDQVDNFCQDSYSNFGASSKSVYIRGDLQTMTLIDVNKAREDDYSAEIIVEKGNQQKRYILGKDEKVTLSEFGNSEEYITLKNLEERDARVLVGIEQGDKGIVTDTINLDINEVESIGNGYTAYVDKINLKKTAHVKISPELDWQGSETNFGFKIGIEKRAIDLSTDQIKNKLEDLNDTIEKWEKISDGLGKVVKGFKAACLGTGAVLTVKNLLGNLDGKAIARKKVMRSEGGWIDTCEEETGDPSKIDQCLLEKNDDIEAEVEQVHNVMQWQNEQIEVLEENAKIENGGLLGGDVIDQEDFSTSYAQKVKSTLESNQNSIVGPDGETIDFKSVVNATSANEMTISEMRELQLYSELAKKYPKNDKYKREFYRLSNNIVKNHAYSANIDNIVTKEGIARTDINSVAFRETTTLTYSGLKFDDLSYETRQRFSGLEGKPVSIVQDTSSGRKFLFVLEDTGTEILPVARNDENMPLIYNYDDGGIAEIENNFDFRKIDRNSYETALIEPHRKVKFFVSEPYKGMPALVPFDTRNGWYVKTDQSLPIFDGVESYQESGALASFDLCNAVDGRIDNLPGEDVCRTFNPGTGQIYGTFPGLSEGETRRVVSRAIDAVRDAARQNEKKLNQGISILGEQMQVGQPAVDVPEVRCQDFMSPKECNLLFNVCDPVVCPPSRCNLGGNFYVQDVIQTGIIGGVALCLPNIREGIKVPVCLTGIKAGVDGLLSVFTSYRDCLDEQLETGKHVGICDEVQSIYLCEFFWRQFSPLANIAIPKLIGGLFGQGTRGGGEYLGVQSAWDNAQGSVNYMTNYYGANSYAAFKARSTEEAGSEVCKNFISARYPTDGEFVGALLEPDSPPQYHAWFHEIPFTSATVPPTSQYKVFYHVFAGKDRGAYYRVYLKSSEGGSFYQDAPSYLVKGGYIGVGDYATETIEFTAPSGYKELCVSVNAQEECGFKEVSTSFALDYMKDKYMEEQASQKNIKTEKECVSGSSSLYSFTQPNVQEGAYEFANPGIYNRGIIRVCSTDNPGKGTAPGRWEEVGYCGSEKVKCWIDTDSVRDTIHAKNIEEGVLDDVTKDYLNDLSKDGLNEGEFSQEVDDFEKIVGRLNQDFGNGISTEKSEIKTVISDIEGIFDKVVLPRQKAYLLYLEARAYNQLTRLEWANYEKQIVRDQTDTTDDDDDGDDGDETSDEGGDGERIFSLTKKGNERYELIIGGSYTNIYFIKNGRTWGINKDNDNWFDEDVGLVLTTGEINFNQWTSFNEQERNDFRDLSDNYLFKDEKLVEKKDYEGITSVSFDYSDTKTNLILSVEHKCASVGYEFYCNENLKDEGDLEKDLKAFSLKGFDLEQGEICFVRVTCKNNAGGGIDVVESEKVTIISGASASTTLDYS